MLLVGLTGGIGSGKSTVSALLVERGAELVDADLIARQVVMPGEPAWRKLRDHFGPEVLTAGGQIDRKALAERAFGDPAKVALLNEITHPAILARIAERLEALRDRDVVVVLDAALLVETGLDAGVDVVVVVHASEAVQRARLEARGVDPEDAAARIAAQTSPETRLERADAVIHNDGSLEDLEARVDELWERLTARLAASARSNGHGNPSADR